MLPWAALRPRGSAALLADSGQEITGLLNLYLGKQMFNLLKCKGKSVAHTLTTLKPPQNALTLLSLCMAIPFHSRNCHLICTVR